jgi:hypothetical protein
MNIGMLENTSMMSRALAIKVIKKSKLTSGSPTDAYYYNRLIKTP